VIDIASRPDDVDMGSTVSIVSAVAASIAATLAAVNLVLSGRREHVKWAREALIEVLVDFVDASFDSKDAVKHAIRAGEPGRWTPGVHADHHDRARDAERRMRVMQSRLRLLATPEVVDAAQILRIETRRYIALLDGEPATARERDAGMRRDLWMLRQQFMDQAKRALALPRPWRRAPRTRPSEALGLLTESDRRNPVLPPNTHG
jgi:hypothetical protein